MAGIAAVLALVFGAIVTALAIACWEVTRDDTHHPR